MNEIDLDELVESVDLVEYVEQFTDLEKRGREYWGLSPLKEENTPSFSIDPEKQCFYDFSSGKSGGIIQFIKEHSGCSTYRAIEKLKEYAGVTGNTKSVPKRLEATKVCRKYGRKTDTGQHHELKVLPERIMDKYIWSEEKLKPWIDEGISVDILKKYDVKYDPVTDRIVYPIRNIKGEIVNIGCRTLDPDYKEKGLRKYSYTQDWNGGMDVIYGLYESLERCIESGYLILFEGAKSVLKAAGWGVFNTGAVLTSHLNTYQMRILLSTCNLNNVAVIFAFDKDVNIADDKNIRKLRSYLRVYYLKDKGNLLNEKDSPVDQGFDVFKELCKNKVALR